MATAMISADIDRAIPALRSRRWSSREHTPPAFPREDVLSGRMDIATTPLR
jgi:hypothetical protein